MARPAADRAASASRDRGKDRDDVAVGDFGVELLEIADVVVVAVHVDELVEPTLVVDELARQPGIAGGELGEDITDGGAVGPHRSSALRVRAQQRGQANLDGHSGHATSPTCSVGISPRWPSRVTDFDRNLDDSSLTYPVGEIGRA